MFNSKGVIELPLRLIVTIVIGGVALTAVLAFLFSPCLFKKDLQVYWDTYKINAGEETTITVSVLNEKGKPVRGATVLLKGLGNATVNQTNETGKAELTIKVTLPEKRHEGYLELIVDAGNCYEKFIEEEAIKVVRS